MYTVSLSYAPSIPHALEQVAQPSARPPMGNADERILFAGLEVPAVGLEEPEASSETNQRPGP